MKVSVVLWLFLFKGGEVLEMFCGVSGQTGLTGLPYRSDRFPLLIERLSPTKAV
jgi:hypothetical protein